MASNRPLPKKHGNWEGVYRPFLNAIFLLGCIVVIGLQAFQVLSRPTSGYALLSMAAVYWLVVTLAERLSGE